VLKKPLRLEGRTPAQLLGVCNGFLQAYEADDSVAVADMINAYASGHLGVDALRTLGIMTGLCAVNASLPKTKMVELLVQHQVPVVPFAVLLEYAAGRIPARADCVAFNAAVLMANAATANTTTPADSGAGADSVAGGAASPPGAGPSAGSSPADAVLHAMLKALNSNSELMSQFVTGQAGSSSSSSSKETPFEKHMKAMTARIKNDLPVPLPELSGRFLEKLRRQATAPAAKHMLGTDMFLTSSAVIPEDTSNNLQFRDCCDGWAHFMHLVGQYKSSAVVLDRIEFWFKVTSSKSLSPTGQVAYIRDFMQKYSAAPSWMASMRSDHQLMFEVSMKYMPTSSAPTAAPATIRAPPLKRVRPPRQGQPPLPSNRNSRSSHAQPPAWAAQVLPKLGPIKRLRQSGSAQSGGDPNASHVCYSRSDPNAPCQYAPNCRFNHACATCGDDHSAAECPVWDDRFLRTSG
jgi:hypothetical protein